MFTINLTEEKIQKVLQALSQMNEGELFDDVKKQSEKPAFEKWAIYWFCGECNKPTSQVEVCEVLGHNPGVDGHLFKSEEAAQKAFDNMIAELKEKDRVDDLDYLENAKVVKVTFEL